MRDLSFYCYINGLSFCFVQGDIKKRLIFVSNMEVIEFIDSLFLGKLLGFGLILYAFDRLFIPNIWWFRKLPLLLRPEKERCSSG